MQVGERVIHRSGLTGRIVSITEWVYVLIDESRTVVPYYAGSLEVIGGTKVELKRVRVTKADPDNWYEQHIGDTFWVYKDFINKNGEYTVKDDMGGYYIHKDHCEDVGEEEE